MNLPKINPLKKYVARAKLANTHQAKVLALSKFLDQVFQVEIEELLPGIELKIGSKILGIKGSIDLLFSNVVFEIKVDLEKELDDAKRKLIKYLQILYEDDPDEKHVGLATDVVKFISYLPVVKNGKVATLKKIGELDLEKSSFEEAVWWLDSFFFSKVDKPTADDLKWRFGPSSPTYALATEELEAMWKEIEHNNDAKLKFKLWAKNMEMVYGSKPEVRSFIEHAFLVTLVKLIVYLKVRGDTTVKKDDIMEAIDGKYFKSYGIVNLVEEDFFTWVLYPRFGERIRELCYGLVKGLLRYDISQVDEDIFKEIYQEIVGPSERHKVGEYYTPEWLSELTLRKTLKEWKKENEGIPRIIDTSCGSGTFLTNAIRLLKEELTARGVPSDEAANVILNNVVGIDINPLAVVIARANYILTLGADITMSKGVWDITIPVYVADSIKLPSEVRAKVGGVDVYSVDADGYYLHVPIKVASDRAIFGQVLEGVRLALESYRSRRNKREAYGILERRSSELNPDERQVLCTTLDTLTKLMDKGLDTIWTFVLNNVYAPIALKENRFDIVVGNPPWIAMRYLENKEYQDFIKKSVFRYALLDKKEVHLFTHMEMATLFFCQTSDMYLKEKGVMGFVMPRSVLTGAFHHTKFRLFKKPVMKLAKIIDLKDVSPLFNVPSCVLICVSGQETGYPILASKYIGKLERKNERLPEALKVFRTSDYMYEPPSTPIGRSIYYDKVKEGATIVPRGFWFVEFDVPPTLWVKSREPAVKTSSSIKMKPPWTNTKLKENIEKNFIYVTLLGGDIVRFGYTEFRPIVLPAEPSASGYEILDVKELMGKGLVGMTNWLERVQQLWAVKATEKSKTNFPRVISWVNYRSKLSYQNPKAKYIVLYNASGSNIASCVINKHGLLPLEAGRTAITPVGFIAEAKSYFYETDDEGEAHYLCAILNSNVVNEAIKPLQPKGLYGEREVGRRPFMFNIPKFRGDDPSHARLAELSKLCHAKVGQLNLMGQRSASARKKATEIVEKELQEIDDVVGKIL